VTAPDPQEVARVSAIADPVIRNLEITECYSRLAAAAVERSSGGSNWCTFATWASRQAGRTIRGEDLLDQLSRELGRDAELLHPVRSAWRWLLRRGLLRPETRLGRLVAGLHTPFDAFELASGAVARGNLKVFEEIGLVFARYLSAPDFEEFLAGLRPGEPPDGQDFLRAAFTRYEQARASTDPKQRAELLVLANLEIGLHEQTRLQPEIREALDAALAPVIPLWRRIVGWPVQRKLTQLSRQVITRSMMVLTLPGTVLSLGRHLEAEYPEMLRTLENPELEQLLARFEPVPPAIDDCGARDWSELRQRMHYIVHLFRAYHERGELASPPFTPEQVERFRAGVVPEGVL
jgi:hypothetical protein